MAKILDVDFGNNVVSVGMENNSVKEIPFNLFKFKPEVGKLINVYQKEDGTYIIEEATEGRIANNGYKIQKVKFLLFTFFLGGFGVHKFITGRTMQGVIYLLFFWTWIPGILAMAEFIIACCKDKDENGMIEIKGFFG